MGPCLSKHIHAHICTGGSGSEALIVVDAAEAGGGEETLLSRLRRRAHDAGYVISYTVYTAAYYVCVGGEGRGGLRSTVGPMGGWVGPGGGRIV